MALAPGSRLGVYDVTAQIGEGGMGQVYRASDTKLKRQVAIKILPPSLAADRDRLARFRREAEVLASLNHTNIAAIHGLEESGGITALVMELVEGDDLSQPIARGPMPPEDALAIARQIAEALASAHEQGIVHRDLKPANIKVRADGTVKVLDFGLAKATEPASTNANALNSPTLSMRATQEGIILGTAAYMSPEQARGRAVDTRTDIWAFGVLLYEMLTGRRPFNGETVSDIMASVLTKEPDLSAVPRPWRRLIGRCLEKDARKRVRDIGDVWLLLDTDGDASGVTQPATRGRVWPWTLAALAAGAAVTWMATAAIKPVTTPSPVAFLEAPSPGTQFIGAPMPSPDGRRLAWIAVDAAGKTRMWTREIGDPSPRPVDGTDAVTIACWSPDSQQLGFVANGKLSRIAAGGGPVSLIVAANPQSVVWLPDGDILLAVTGAGFLRVPATGGALRPANGFTSETFRTLQIDGLATSPDGRFVLFSQFGGETGVYVARVDGTATRLLYPGRQSPAVFVGADLIVGREANVLMAQRFNAADMTVAGEAFPVAQNVSDFVFTGSATGSLSFIMGARATSRLTWFTRDGKAVGVAGPEGEYTEVAISRGGRWLGFVRRDAADGNFDVWLQALPGGAPRRITSDPDIDHLFTISHDEREVAWEAHAKGTLNLMRRPVDASATAQLVRLWGKAGGPADWSPDGRFVLYRSEDGPSGSHLWAVPMGGSGDPIRLTQPGSNSGHGQFSPNGRWLAFVGQETGQEEVYVQRVEDMKLVGGPVRVSEGGGQWPQWRGDGTELFFLGGGALMAVEFQDRSDRPAGEPRSLFTLAVVRSGPFGYGRRYAVTPDGQRVLAIVSATDHPSQPATVILNWRESINKQ